MLSRFESLYNAHARESVQALAWARFQELGLPSQKMERYAYAQLRKVYESVEEGVAPAFSSDHCLPECPYRLVFVNGAFVSELSELPQGLVVKALDSPTYATYLKGRQSRLLKTESDSFALLNTALYSEGLFLYVPPKLKIEAPIQLLHLCGGIAMPRLHLFVGAGASLRFIKSAVASPSSLCNSFTDLHLESGAHCELQSAALGDAFTMETIRAELLAKSCCSLRLAASARFSRFDLDLNLSGEEAETGVDALNLVQATEESHLAVRVVHEAPNCRSRQQIKSVLRGPSRSSFNGNIRVLSEAQKTDAFQLSKSLLLNDNALSYSRPQLEIDADDVKASHGSTVGQVDPEQLHYLMARGISRQSAEAMIALGFVEGIAALFIKSLRDDLLERMP